MDDKKIFATNLAKYMELNEKTRSDISRDLGYSYYTVTDWVKAKKMPRMDKIKALANYFGVSTGDLIEEEVTEDIKEKGDTAVDITIRLGNDVIFREVVKRNLNDNEFLELSNELRQLDTEQIVNLRRTLKSLLK